MTNYQVTMITSTKIVFLRCMALVYMFAFASLYTQIPGLYGANGILPAHLTLKCPSDLRSCISEKPTLLWFAGFLKLNVELMMELLCLIGTVLGFLGFVAHSACNTFTFIILWVLYCSLYQVGQTFLSFQWDVLLLEAGFLSIIVAPLEVKIQKSAPRDKVSMWLIRWLLFRLMFASGVMKLRSLCPVWWDMRGFVYYYQSQFLPTPAAWYLHQAPEWFQKMSQVYVHLSEIAVAFLFFSPVKSVRMFAFYLQLYLQVNIILTGNYNFYSILSLVLCLSLFDDEIFESKKKRMNNVGNLLLAVKWVLSWLFQLVVYSSLIYGSFLYFNLRFKEGGIPDSSFAFSKAEFQSEFMRRAVPFGISVGVVSLFFTCIKALFSAFKENKGFMKKTTSVLSTVIHIILAICLFGISLVPFTVIDTTSNQGVWPVFKSWHYRTSHLAISNSHGLFKKMTGVEGRDEVVLAGALNQEGPWKEIPFLYKAGNVSMPPPFVVPHQPRLDWQMFFAALGTYEENPWFVSMVYRLLNNQQEVLQLLDQSRYPFKKQPPAYIKAISFKYHYTDFSSGSTKWWVRKKAGEYLTPLNKDHPSLKDYIKKMGVVGKDPLPVNSMWRSILSAIREWVGIMNTERLIWALTVTALVITLTKRKTKFL